MILRFALLACAACGGAQPAQPAIANARLAAGPTPPLGCFAWSEAQHAAACIVGDSTGTAMLAFVDGRSETIPLPAPLTEEFTRTANERLSRDGYAALTATAQPLPVGQTRDIGPAKLSFTKRPFSSDKPSPTTFQVRGLCPHDEPNVIAMSLDDGDMMVVAVRRLGDHAIVEYTVRTVNDGAQIERFDAVVFDAKQCATRSALEPQSR